MRTIDILPDIPRYLTAVAEWSSVIIYCWLYHKKINQTWVIRSFIFLSVQVFLQLLAGVFPIELWIPGMIMNICWMLFCIKQLTGASIKIELFILAKAFILSELLASIAWLMYCLTLYQRSVDNTIYQAILNILLYALILVIPIYVERKQNIDIIYPSLTNKDIVIGLLVSTITFTISNIGFLLSSTTYKLGNSLAIFVLRIFANLSGYLLIYMQQYLQLDNYRKKEITNMNNLINSQYQQYLTYAESTEHIGRKAHDLKHQIEIILAEADSSKRESYISNLRSEISKLEVKIETGNAVLDTILTQKNQYCAEHQINFTSMANGALLDKMDIMDLSSLIGNALDNAIEYIEQIEDIEKRLITLKLTNKGEMIILRVDNYFLDDWEHSEDLPQTTKPDKENHGYGLKSIQHTAEKYNGNILIKVENNWFSLSVIFPLIE